MTWSYYELQAENLNMAREQGIEVIEPDADMMGAVQDYVREDVQLVGQIYADNYGITRTDEIANEFVEVLDRWNGLVAGVESVDDLAEIYWNEIFSKVDPETYGVN
jgi:hypothetical protein